MFAMEKQEFFRQPLKKQYKNELWVNTAEEKP